MEGVEWFRNPNFGATDFDVIFAALMTVFQCITMEGWNDTQLNSIRAYGSFCAIYFTLLVLIGSFFLVNFTLAVIKSQVSKLYSEAAAARGKKIATAKSVMNEDAKKSIGLILKQGQEDPNNVRMDNVRDFFFQQEIFNRLNNMDRSKKRHYSNIMGFDEFEELGNNIEPIPKLLIHNDVIEEVDESLPSININDNLKKVPENGSSHFTRMTTLPVLSMRGTDTVRQLR